MTDQCGNCGNFNAHANNQGEDVSGVCELTAQKRFYADWCDKWAGDYDKARCRKAYEWLAAQPGDKTDPDRVYIMGVLHDHPLALERLAYANAIKKDDPITELAMACGIPRDIAEHGKEKPE